MKFAKIKKFWNLDTLKYISAFLIPAIFIILANQSLDNDSWFILAEGRHITTNGIFYNDVLSMHNDLNIAVQQYGFATIFWLAYSVLGTAGPYILMLLFNFCICIILYKICLLISHKNINLSLLLMLITDTILILGFITTRPQILSYTIFLLVIYILELYVKTDKTKYLWWIPILSIIQINCHASLWFMIFILLSVYIIDSIKSPKLHLQGYKTRPLIIVTIISLLAGLLNPYGIRMVTYIFTSYGVSAIFNMVDEMRPFNLRTIFNVLLYISIVVTLILYIFGKNKNIRARYLILFFGFFALGINSIKGMSHLILVMFFPLALLYKNKRMEHLIDAPIGRNAILLWTGVLSVSIFVVASAVTLPKIPTGINPDIVAAVDTIDQSESQIEKRQDITVYTGYNDGGYLEFRGYKSYIDPRAEVFLKANNKKEDILQEWTDFKKRKTTDKSLIEKYNFDYIFINNESDLFQSLDENNEYKMIYENSDSTVKVYQHNITQ